MQYRILAPSAFPTGSVLTLSEAQAASRRHALKPLGTGIYEALAPVSFKAGEIVGYAGDLPKAWGDSIEEAAAPTPTGASVKPAATVRRVPRVK